MSESNPRILLEDDENAMFGQDDDEEDEEEDEDVDMTAMTTTTTATASNNAGVVKMEEDRDGGAVKTEEVDEELFAGDDDDDEEEKEEEEKEQYDHHAPSALPTPKEEPVTTASPRPLAMPPAAAATAATVNPALPPPSPFPHHNSGPTADRLRNATNRIAADPTRDAEAWQALLTEAQSSYRALLPSLGRWTSDRGRSGRGGDGPTSHGRSRWGHVPLDEASTPTSTDAAEAESLGRKLDWVEGCYGALFHHFPYAVPQYVQWIEMLLRLSAVTAEEVEMCGRHMAQQPALAGTGMLGGSSATAGRGGGGGAGASALSDPELHTIDQGVAIPPFGLIADGNAIRESASERQRRYDARLDELFEICLGVDREGNPVLYGSDYSDDELDGVTEADGQYNDDDHDGSGNNNNNNKQKNRNNSRKQLKPNQFLPFHTATKHSVAKTILGGLAKHSTDLWLLYIRKQTRDAIRISSAETQIPVPPPGYIPGATNQTSVIHSQYEESLRVAYRERREYMREKVTRAYEIALEHGAGFAMSNHLIWKRYANFVKSWTGAAGGTGDVSIYAAIIDSNPGLASNAPPLPPADPTFEHTSAQKQLNQLRSIYQRGVTHPMTGLDQFWQEYEAFERAHSESLASVLIAEWLPKYQHARSVYLERNRVWTIHDLRAGRLAVPPVGCETGVGGGGGGLGGKGGVGGGKGGGPGVGATGGGVSGGGAGATVVGADDDFAGDGAGGAGGAGGGKAQSDSELLAQLEEERIVLSKWRRRAAYERTNPERLNAADHAMRVRASYCEEVCAFARHPEVWFEWSQWELLHGSSIAATATAPSGPAGTLVPSGSASSAALIAPAKAGDLKSGGNALRAVAVLTLGMESLPDSALLAQAQAEILERFLVDDAKNREKRPIGGAIKVMERFVKRAPTTLGFVLLQRLVRRHEGIAAARAVFARARRTLRVREEDMTDEDRKEAMAKAAAAKKETMEDIEKDGTHEDSGDVGGIGGWSHQRLVTNRLKPTVGVNRPAINGAASPSANAGFITWHLYAAHATIEHRLSKNPQVAARIFELGLRKHRTFLSTPPYVLHYASLLLELHDEENLRSLLMRAVAACEDEEANAAASGNNDPIAIARRREIQRPLWDMMLKFESILSSRSGSGNVSADIRSIEARRRRALYGPGNEDVVMGGEAAPDEEEDRNLGTGVQKSSLNEQLIRVEGYDVASRIANGMMRMVDTLTVTGAMGNGESDTSNLNFVAAASASLAAGGSAYDIWGDECAGGPSDTSYVRRLRFQREGKTRAISSALFGGTSGANQGIAGGAGKLLSSRERAAGAAQNALAIQNAPEWLRPLLLLLPPIPKHGRGLTKPPPHLIEMALSTMRANALPNRPADIASTITNGTAPMSKKRDRADNDGDSSDEENGTNGASFGAGYSNQFRSRQRSRLFSANNGGNAS